MKKILSIAFFTFSLTVMMAQTENFWTKKSDFGGMKRERCVGFSIGDVGYMGMGIDTNGHTKKDWWAYDALTDTWTQRATLPGSVRRNAVGFAIGNLGYVGTGVDSSEASPGLTLKDFWEYNPTTNSWTQKADYPGNGGAGVYYATAFVLDYKGYVVGGKVGSQVLTDEVWEYKPYNNTWVQRANFPGGNRYQMTSFSVAGKAYVGCGADQNTYRDEMWEFNGGNGVWTAKADFAGGDRGQVVSFTLGERGFICTGKDGGLKSDLWEYNPFTDSWTARASYGGSARCSAAGFVCYGKAYVGTGDGYSGKKESVWEYTPVLVLGIDDNQSMKMSMYPNPVTDIVTIQGCESAEQIRLLDMSGREVFSSSVNNQNSLNIDCSEFASGIYFVQMISENKTVFTDKIAVR